MAMRECLNRILENGKSLLGEWNESNFRKLVPFIFECCESRNIRISWMQMKTSAKQRRKSFDYSLLIYSC